MATTTIALFNRRAAVLQYWSESFVDGDCTLGTVGRRLSRLCFQLQRHVRVEKGVPIVIHLEDLGRKDDAAQVTLALLRVDSSAHGSPLNGLVPGRTHCRQRPLVVR